MTRNRHTFLAAFLAVALAAAPAAAEKTVAVNDPASPGVFDQPAVAMSGSTAHVAYIGAGTTSGPFSLYYAAVSGRANFSDLGLTRDTAGFLVTAPVAVDNTDAGNDPYVDARHPRIALRSSSEAVILFQAKAAASPNPEYVLYLARLTLDNNAVVRQTVKVVTGLSGFNEDVSFALVSKDNTARVAYAGRAALSSRFGVYYARVAVDNAAVTGTPGTPLLLTSTACSDGTRPLPVLRLDSADRSHVAWAANSDTPAPSPVCYGMVRETGGADNVAISGTPVLGSSRKWGTPNLQVSSKSSISILAVDEALPGTAGNLGRVTVNPDQDDQDGSPVQIGTTTKFLLSPGETILPDSFDLYRPESIRDTLGNFHMAGYASGGTNAVYFAFRPTTSFPFGSFTSNRVPVGLDSPEYPVELPGDYTRPGFGFVTSGKAIVFWSGQVPGTGFRNLNVTGIPTLRAVKEDESGCSAVSGDRPQGLLAAALLLLPALLIGLGGRLRRKIGG